ncbi:MAG TPA: glycosyltransferase [Ignavibacteria bacterium]|nr:glycosyltransferase [Ignavibacteria bacterium]
MPDLFPQKKKISIIIPALNEEKLLERLLKQFNQEIKKKFDLEVIVSDGGSSDLTIQIARKHSDNVILHYKNSRQNISQGRNEGAKNSLGDVLIFLNADTFVKDLDHMLQVSTDEILENDITALACPICVFPEEEKFSDKAFHFFYNTYVHLLNRFFMGMGRGECHIVSREKFFEAGGYNEKLAAGEDYDLYKRLKKSGKLKFRKDIIIFESPRRYRRFGYPRVLWDWAKNSVSVTLFNRSISKKWEAVR